MLLNHKQVYRMKKVLFTIIAAILSITAFAQSEHLTFKGVPIDGTLNQFVTKMKTAGFTGGVDKNGTALLKGDFAGYKGCYIIVSTLQNKDLVSTIGVLFPECPNWSTLEGNYYKLKEMLTTKYGEPAEAVEEFQHPRSADDDSSKIHELKMDRCNYSTLFRTEKGNLVLRLVTDDYNDCHVLLGYYDKINGLEVEAAAMDDL
jgi:hypothetical protein